MRGLIISFIVFYFCTATLNPTQAAPDFSEEKLGSFQTLFFEQCPLAKSNNLPIEMDLRGDPSLLPFKVDLQALLFRLVQVNDIAQTMSLYLDVTFSWNLPCPDGLLEKLGPVRTLRNDYLFIKQDSNSMWYPNIQHLNAATESYPFEHITGVAGFNPLHRPKPQGSIEYMGVLETSCETMSFAKFPFDILDCYIELEFVHSNAYLAFGKVTYGMDPACDLVGPTDIWEQQHPLKYTLESVIHGENTTFDNLKLYVQLKRKYQYFVGNTLLPIYSLIMLQILCLFIEPKAPDRPTFAMTVVLAFAVVLSLVFASIPRTSETVYLVQNVEVKMILCVLLTVYCLVINPLATEKWAVRIRWQFRDKIELTTVRMIDLLVGVLSTIIIVICDAIYITAMIY